MLTASSFLLSACGGVPGGPLAPIAPATAALTSSSYTLLHDFGTAQCDGLSPYAGLIAVNGTLYGTSSSGGGSNVGTIFSMTPSGTERTLYDFPKKSQFGGRYGYEPVAPLIETESKLFGTTQYGGTPGSRGYGTVFGFKIPGSAPTRKSSGLARQHCISAGNVHLIHRFSGGSDGANPVSGLLDVSGVFYGTTPSGGTFGAGTVFRVTPPRTERVLYNFGSTSDDAAKPYAGLIDVNGILYGTTVGGGNYSEGTVFSIRTSGTEQVLHSFGSGADGSLPQARLIDDNGTLYGTTAAGGTNGDGTVFSITPSGSERVLFNFDGLHGKYPLSALTYDNGKLYGTTEIGGFFPCYSNECGTVYSITTAGKEIVLHSFRGFLYGDGEYPSGDLIVMQGTLYGTTQSGGVGQGTAFSLKP